MNIDFAEGWNLEVLMLGVVGLWLLATGGRSGNVERLARQIPDEVGSPGYGEKRRRIAAKYPEVRLPYRIAGAVLMAGSALYLWRVA